MVVPSNDLLRQYKAYDLRCDVVSSFEVFLTRGSGLSDTVAHFERFPRWTPQGQQEVKPDFTVRFTDDTMLVGEIANLARDDGSLKSLLHQTGRYDALTDGPSAPRPPQGHEVHAVTAVDVLLLIPLAEMNAACDRIADAIAHKRWDYEPSTRPTVIGYSYEDTGAGNRLVFSFADRGGNPYLRDHGREPSLTRWLKGNSDTLTCSAEHFARLTASKRFMNDPPPPLYMAVMLWQEFIPRHRTTPKDKTEEIRVAPGMLADEVRANYGWGTTSAVRQALELLEVAGLARRRRDQFSIWHKTIARGEDAEVRSEIALRAEKRGRPQLATSEEKADARERRLGEQATAEANEEAQMDLDIISPAAEDETPQ